MFWLQLGILFVFKDTTSLVRTTLNAPFHLSETFFCVNSICILTAVIPMYSFQRHHVPGCNGHLLPWLSIESMSCQSGPVIPYGVIVDIEKGNHYDKLIVVVDLSMGSWQWNREYSIYVPSQWKTVLQNNAISHWLDTYTKRSPVKTSTKVLGWGSALGEAIFDIVEILGHLAGLILGLRPAHERRRYFVMTRLSLAGRKPRISPDLVNRMSRSKYFWVCCIFIWPSSFHFRPLKFTGAVIEFNYIYPNSTSSFGWYFIVLCFYFSERVHLTH